MSSVIFNNREHFAKRDANLKSKKLLSKNYFNMKSKVLLPIMAMVILAGAMFFAGCEKEKKTEENKCAICGVGNPLEDLTWLKTMADTFSQHKENRSSIRTCKYDINKEGFIIADCENCPDLGVSLFACDGTHLCHFFGISGKPCGSHIIDTNSIKLIYKNY